MPGPWKWFHSALGKFFSSSLPPPLNKKCNYLVRVPRGIYPSRPSDAYIKASLGLDDPPILTTNTKKRNVMAIMRELYTTNHHHPECFSDFRVHRNHVESSLKQSSGPLDLTPRNPDPAFWRTWPRGPSIPIQWIFVKNVAN